VLTVYTETIGRVSSNNTKVLTTFLISARMVGPDTVKPNSIRGFQLDISEAPIKEGGWEEPHPVFMIRARTIEELVPLSLSSPGTSHLQSDIRRVVYKADDLFIEHYKG